MRGYRNAVRLLLLFAVAGLTVSCQESLPTYVKPAAQFNVIIYPESNPIILEELLGPPILNVYVTEPAADERIDQIIIPVPYNIRVKLMVFLDSDPLRQLEMVKDQWYTDPDDEMAPGKTIPCLIGNFPFSDGEGRAWNADDPAVTSHTVVIRGTVEIPRVSFKANIPEKRVTIIYPEP